MKKNIILSKEESTLLKIFCNENNIPFFRTECFENIYCEMNMTDEQEKMVNDFLKENIADYQE